MHDYQPYRRQVCCPLGDDHAPSTCLLFDNPIAYPTGQAGYQRDCTVDTDLCMSVSIPTLRSCCRCAAKATMSLADVAVDVGPGSGPVRQSKAAAAKILVR